MSSTARYATGQTVKVLAYQPGTFGQPHVWVNGTVTGVESRDDGLFDVQVRTTWGTWEPQIVGPRGGNRRIREVAV